MYYIVIIVLLFCIFIAIQKRKSERAMKKATDDFWEREREANMARKKDISNLPYIKIPLEELPLSALSESDEYQSAVRTLRTLSENKILDLSEMTNTDLKLTYGPANLPTLMECDQNYLILIRTLSQMATLLCENGLWETAEPLLWFSVEIKSSIRSVYERLASLYQKSGNQQKLDYLLHMVAESKLAAKDSLLASLTEKRNQTDANTFHFDELFEEEE